MQHASIPHLIFLAAFCAAAAPAQAADCAYLNKHAADREVRLVPTAEYKVAGSGRLYFHVAPDAACRDPKLFVIPGDKLIGYSEFNGYTSIMYLNPKSGEDFLGWVESKRLVFTGSIGHYSPPK